MHGANSTTRRCQCGCGAEFVDIVADREDGVRADAAASPSFVPLDASDHRVAVLITGAVGAGKSTVARQLALRFDRGVHIDIDMVFHHFTVTGRVDAAEDSEERDRQSNLAVRNAAAMAHNYLDAGFACVLEGAVALRRQVELCTEVVAPWPLALVVLAPPLEASEDRDRRRSGKHVAETFRFLHPLIHRELAGLGLWIDSAALTPGATVEVVLRHLDAAGTGNAL